MDNMGGLIELYYIEGKDFISLVKGENNIWNLTLENGAKINKIDFTQETGKFSIVSEDTDNGTIYNFETSCRIPKCGPDNNTPLGEARQKRLLILGRDNNDRFILAGSPGSYFNSTLNSSTGEAAQDPNSRQLKINASLTEEPGYIASPL